MQPRRIVSIGCSCINRFQFNFFIQRNPQTADMFPRGLFDWNIASLVSSIRLLELARDKRLTSVLNDTADFHVAFDALIHHRSLPGFSFFHEDTPHELLASPSRRQAFFSKLAHLTRVFVDPDLTVPTCLVWSNLQPNLPDTVKNVIPWEDFILTPDRIAQTRAVGKAIFGPNTTFAFLTTPDDAEPAVFQDPDVRRIDLPRSTEYEGPPKLYDPVLSKLICKSD